VSAYVILLWKGELFLDCNYLSNIITEMTGIIVTGLMIDVVFLYFSDKEDKLYRNLALKQCRKPILECCGMWKALYDRGAKVSNITIYKGTSVSDFFLSTDFFTAICQIDFAKTTRAQFCVDKLKKIEDDFQKVLSKYAGRLNENDLTIIEYIANADIYNEIYKMEFASRCTINVESADNIKFSDYIDKQTLDNYFRNLLQIIDAYNKVNKKHPITYQSILDKKEMFKTTN